MKLHKSNLKRGKLITMEGIERSGKSGCMPLIARWVDEQGYKLVQSREPGGTPIAESIRKLLLAKRDEAIDPASEFLLIAAARKQHLEQLILPALEQGSWVLLDRFIDSSIAYQGYGRGLSLSFIDMVHQHLLDGLQPDLTFWFDVSLNNSRNRLGEKRDRFESLDDEFFHHANAGFSWLHSQNQERIKCIDANQSIEAVHQQVRGILKTMTTVV